ncbi:hypothetical protein EMPS_01845 [Entomortierella parvispora]|uniref:AB hydrolase-1 domain-containing protein n=1 Tax=Entomortierella parvispora TaxID=205924 RepID=A0A9P3H3R0_9FUNG|nr:hypothetical protein EMPS_01845 [Entomortierella parvispora]
MNRSNSNGKPFHRRQSSAAPPPVAYANPAATQFLRLGVGIDHVDVGQSDDEDIIYQGIENGMESLEDDEDDEEDEDEEEEEEDEGGEEGNTSQNPGELLAHSLEINNDSNTGAQEQSQNNEQHSDSNAAVLMAPLSSTQEPAVSALQSSCAADGGAPPNTRRPPMGIDTKRKSISLPPKEGPASPSSPISPSTPLAKGLPVYHENFTKATTAKIHGASPLGNADNNIIASTVSAAATATAPGAAGSAAAPAGRHQTAGHSPMTETARAQGSEPAPYVLPIRRFAEKVGFVTIHNWKIHYKVCYPTQDPSYIINGNGRNIVLFHGALSNLGTWRKVQQTLADRTGCRVLSYDRVGHGLSDKPSKWPKNANPYKNGGVMAICQTLLETLGMNQNLVLLGNGTGATVASALALSKPQLARGLILIAPSIQDESPPLYLRACVSYPPPLSWIYKSLYGDHGPLQQLYYKPKTILSDPKTLEMYMNPTKEEGFWRGLSNSAKYRESFKIMSHLDRLTEMSTLVITGDVDDVVPTIETLRLFETLQSVRQFNVPQVLKIVKHAGHLPQEEKPNDFTKVASFFIRKVCLGSLSRERSLGRRVSGGVARSGSKKSVNRTDMTTAANTEINAHSAVPPPRHPAPGPNPGPMSSRVPAQQILRVANGPSGAMRGPPMIPQNKAIPGPGPTVMPMMQGQPVKSH